MRTTNARQRSRTPRSYPGATRAAACLLVWLCTLWSAGSATFTASLDRDTITLGESAALALTFTDGEPETPPTPPQVPGLQITYLGPSSQITIVDRQTTSVVTHNFRVVPRQAGEFTIPGMAAKVGGQELRTQPLSLRVVQATAPTPDSINAGQQLAFLKLIVPKRQVFVGETFVIQLHLYLRRGVQGLRGFDLANFPPDASSGWLAGKAVQGQRSETQVGNFAYTVIPLHIPLKALRAGAIPLGPISASAALELPSARRRDPFFDRFGIPDVFGGGTETRNVTMATEEASITSLPLPTENVPPLFNGAVGSYTLNVTAGPTNVATGDPITVKVQISGRGTLDTLTLPEQPDWRDFKTYPPTSKVESSDPLGLTGVKTFEQVIVPDNPGIKALPPLTFSFFDPDRKQYRSLSSAALPLTVRPGGATPAPTVAAGPNRNDSDNPPPTRDIVHIKQRLGSLGQVSPPILTRSWFLALQGLPLGAFLVALLWRRHADHLARNPRLRRRREVDALVRRGLDDLRQQAAGKNSGDFFATLFRLLQERLGERLDLPATSITEAVIEERLRPRGVPESTLARLQELFLACNTARYAPVQSPQELTALAARAESALEAIRDLEV